MIVSRIQRGSGQVHEYAADVILLTDSAGQPIGGTRGAYGRFMIAGSDAARIVPIY